MENKKIRNPFPALGKVCKYEFLNSYRVLLPVYAVLLFVSLLSGLVLFRSDTLPLDGEAQGNLFRTLLGFVSMVIYFASFAVSLVYLEKRFKQGMLGDEAYLNLSLPVTLGEHVWGRALVSFVWALIYAVVIGLSFLLLCIRGWSEIGDIFRYFSEEAYYLGTSFVPALVCLCISAFFLMLMFCYLVNAISHLAKRHRKLIEVIAAVVIISIVGNFGYRWIDIDTLYGGSSAASVMWSVMGANLVYSVIFGIATQLILRFRLNLE